jgi:hypothetical protein
VFHEQHTDLCHGHLSTDWCDVGRWIGWHCLRLRDWWRTLLPLNLWGNLPTIGKVFGEEAVIRRLSLRGPEPAKPVFGAVDPDAGVS